MINRISTTLLLCMVFSTLACGGGSRRVTLEVPPRVDLRQYGRVGLVIFTIENAEGSLHEFATQRFAEEVFAAQSGVEVLELGPEADLLEELGARRLGPNEIRALGTTYDVPAVFLGHIVVSDVKPRASLNTFPPRLGADASVRLSIRLLSAESGAMAWTASGQQTQSVADLGIFDGLPRFSAQDPQEAYGELVDNLMVQVTRDLRPTYRRVRQRSQPGRDGGMAVWR